MWFDHPPTLSSDAPGFISPPLDPMISFPPPHDHSNIVIYMRIWFTDLCNEQILDLYTTIDIFKLINTGCEIMNILSIWER